MQKNAKISTQDWLDWTLQLNTLSNQFRPLPGTHTPPTQMFHAQFWTTTHSFHVLSILSPHPITPEGFSPPQPCLLPTSPSSPATFTTSSSWLHAHSIDTLMNEVQPEAWNSIFCSGEFFTPLSLSCTRSLAVTLQPDYSVILSPMTRPGLFQWVAKRQGPPRTPIGGEGGRHDRKLCKPHDHCCSLSLVHSSCIRLHICHSLLCDGLQ